ncbi:MAG: DUF2231 domain-containing protein [Gemmatimonadaceae bacterium]
MSAAHRLRLHWRNEVASAGVIGGLVAAVFGCIEHLAIPSGTPAKHVGRLHGIGNVVVLL